MLTHEVHTILELGALLQELLLPAQLLVSVLFVGNLVEGLLHLSCHLVVPVDVELGYAGLLCQDMAGQASDVRLRGRILVEFGAIVLHIDVVADSEELLLFVRAGKKNGRDSYDVLLRDGRYIWWLSLEDKFHLTRHAAIHFSLLEYLIILWVARLTNINDTPRQSYIKVSLLIGGKIPAC